MASIKKRIGKNGQESYLIRVFIDQSRDGSQKMRSMTWKPPVDANGKVKMSPAKVEKEVKRQATLFEESVKKGLISFDGNTRFEDYAAKWITTVRIEESTRRRYGILLERVNAAIGSIRLEKLQAHHIEAFYQNLREEGMSKKGGYAVNAGFSDLLEERGLAAFQVCKMVNMSNGTLYRARDGERIQVATAKRIAAALSVPVESIFEVHEETTGLSEKTVHHHHRLISSILGKAKKEGIIPFNVAAERATAPKPPRKEAKYMTDEEARRVVECLYVEEDIRIKTILFVLLYTGVRLGELCGLSWPDIDMQNGIVNVRRASQYLPHVGVIEVTTKTASSVRAIKVPQALISILSQYRTWWLEQRLLNGSKWQGDLERIFIQANGKPIHPQTIGPWIRKFCERHELPKFTAHTCRHTFATLQISSGVDIRTLQARTGHATATTLLNIYSHAIKSATEAAADALDDKLTPDMYKEKA